jgi:hypothetical protein
MHGDIKQFSENACLIEHLLEYHLEVLYSVRGQESGFGEPNISEAA